MKSSLMKLNYVSTFSGKGQPQFVNFPTPLKLKICVFVNSEKFLHIEELNTILLFFVPTERKDYMYQLTSRKNSTVVILYTN